MALLAVAALWEVDDGDDEGEFVVESVDKATVCEEVVE